MNEGSEDQLLEAALQAIQETLQKGQLNKPLPETLAGNARLLRILDDLRDLYQFTLATSQGDLTPVLKLRGATAGGLKALQGGLRHLTWQAQEVARGDFSQRVDFMGEFSVAFNQMVESLAESRARVEQREAELLAMNQALQHEIIERERAEEALRAYAAELEASNAELDAFSHTVAHDLKTPLASVVGFSKLLEARLEQGPAAQNRESLRAIARNGQRMANIIDDLLLLASVRKMDQIRLEPLDMQAIVTDALDRLSGLAAEREATFVTPEGWPVAVGIPGWVGEVWVNYMSNAIKYGGRWETQVPPLVELGWNWDGDGGRLRFWVRDNGNGLTEAQREVLFTQFTRLYQVQVQGYGLGLSIVRRIVERLGGQVGVESAPGLGSTFWFTLQRAA